MRKLCTAILCAAVGFALGATTPESYDKPETVTIEISPAMWGITVDPHGNRIVATYKAGERAAWIQLVNCLAGRGISTVQTLGRPVPPPTIRVNVLSRYRQLECRSSG